MRYAKCVAIRGAGWWFHVMPSLSLDPFLRNVSVYLKKFNRSAIVFNKRNQHSRRRTIRLNNYVFPGDCLRQVFHFKRDMGNSLNDFRVARIIVKANPFYTILTLANVTYVHLQVFQINLAFNSTLGRNAEVMVLQIIPGVFMGRCK